MEPSGRSGSSRRLPVAGFALLAVGLVVAGFVLDRSMRTEMRRRAGAELDAVVSLKVAAIVAWREEHVRIAVYAATYPVLERVVQAAARGHLDPVLLDHAREVVAHLGGRQGYLRLTLMDADGSELAGWRDAAAPDRPFGPALLQRALARQEVATTDLYDPEGLDRPWLDVAVPIRPAGVPPAVLALRVDMAPFFESLLTSWPVPSRTAAAGLARPEGEGALILRAPRESSGGVRVIHVPAAEVERTALQAVRGQIGIRQGLDDRQHEILSAARPVPDSPWTVVCKMDLAEIEAPLVRPAQTIFALLGALLLAGGAMLALWWRQDAARARVEEALRESEGRFRMALAGTHYVWDWDLVARRLEVDAAWPEAVGRPGQVLEGSVSEIMAAICHPEDLAVVVARIEAHLRGEVPIYEGEYRTVLPDGSIRWLLVRGQASRRDAAGRALRMTGVVSDVTERRRRQEQMERTERMASLGTLAAGLAHEVNNPLASVLANLEVLGRELGREGRPEISELVADARDGAERVRDVVKSLRTFAHPDSEERVVADLRSEIEAAVRLSRNEVRHRARLQVHLGELPPVAAAGHQLGQVFLNLLTNAAQAIPEGRVEANLISVEAGTDASGWARVEVSDTGAGIAPKVLKRIFEPFFTTKPQGVGTGLGLALVHSIVAGSGGRIEVESRPGGGSTFRVLLPPATGPARQRPLATTPLPGGGAARRLLLVDDDPLVARALVRLLRRKHQVEVAGTGQEALARLDAGERYDAILCDLMMPQMSGMELHARLTECYPALARRMIFVTGGAFTEGASEFLRTVDCPCLEKPVDAALLAAAIEQVAPGGQARPD
jgi:PAS domain S-box-containing protein